MSVQGILLIDLLGLALIILLINLVRRERLYVTYALIWIASVAGLMVIVSIPSLLYGIPALLGAVYPASALSLLGFVFTFVFLIFVSVKLTRLSARQTELIQMLAIKDLEIAESEADAGAGETGVQGRHG